MMLNVLVVFLLFLLLFFVISCDAFGFMAHKAIAAVIWELLDNQEQEFIRNHFVAAPNKSNPNPLLKLSTYADEIKHVPELTWTQPLHYINLPSQPPNSCPPTYSLPYTTGEKGDNLYSSSLNYTTATMIKRIRDKATEAEREQNFAFFLHFVSDLHLPVHVTGWRNGGNSVSLKNAGEGNQSVSLHFINDSLLFESIVEGKPFEGNFNVFCQYLISQVMGKDLKCSGPISRVAIRRTIRKFLIRANKLNCQGPYWRISSETTAQEYMENIAIEAIKNLIEAAVDITCMLKAMIRFNER